MEKYAKPIDILKELRKCPHCKTDEFVSKSVSCRCMKDTQNLLISGSSCSFEDFLSCPLK